MSDQTAYQKGADAARLLNYERRMGRNYDIRPLMALDLRHLTSEQAVEYERGLNDNVDPDL